MDMNWPSIIPKVEPLVFRVHAGEFMGTAFAVGVSDSDGGRHTMLATALHVVQSVLGNDRPIDLLRGDGVWLSTLSEGPIVIRPVGPPEFDIALIQVSTKEPLLTRSQLLPMPLETMLPRGADVGWLGYPGLAFPELCFFRGVVSGYRERPPLYLLDGVAINGVSGGPAFDRDGLLIGIVSAYLPNQITHSTTLPGLMMLTPINIVRLYLEEDMGARVLSRESAGR